MNETLLSGVMTLLTAPAIVALVNLAKNLGLTGKWSAVVAVSLGVGIAFGERFAPTEIWQTLAQGVTVGLAAAGFYDLAANEPEVPTVRDVPLD